MISDYPYAAVISSVARKFIQGSQAEYIYIYIYIYIIRRKVLLNYSTFLTRISFYFNERLSCHLLTK